ncbi:MAG: DNA-binding protein [Burkholderiaceae bacterium]|nr:DNA-binding protein [Burkholderiaceae bacterium]
MKNDKKFPALKDETRTHVDTVCAAFHLNRRPQTLRWWSCLGNGPIAPKRINGRLAWSVADIKRLLRGAK